MDYTLEKQSVCTASSALDTVVQQLVDVDLTLPDYCPDIQKILKCMMTPKIFTKNISGGQLQIDGTTEVKIVYCDGIQKHFRCCEQLVPFTVAIPLKSSPENYAAIADAKVEYINCRALSPRRLVIHGAFSLYAKVIAKGTVDLFSPVEDETLQTKCLNTECLKLSSFCQEEIPINEEITLENKPPVESVIKSSLSISTLECKAIPSKLLLNGELNLRLLYLSDIDTGNLENIDYILPFSHIVDCEGVNENTVNKNKSQISCFDIRLRSDPGEESPVISLEAKITFTHMGFEKFGCQVISDAFSTKYRTNTDTVQCSLLKDVSSIKETIMHKANISAENTGLDEIVEIYSEYCTLTPLISDDTLTLNGKMNICVFARDKEKTPMYLERTTEFKHTIAAGAGFNSISDCRAKVASISYRLNENGGIDLRCEIKLSAVLEFKENTGCVCAVHTVEDSPVNSSDSAVIVYFAQKGESVWEITKAYHSPYSLMLEENNITAEVLTEPKTLIIPLL